MFRTITSVSTMARPAAVPTHTLLGARATGNGREPELCRTYGTVRLAIASSETSPTISTPLPRRRRATSASGILLAKFSSTCASCCFAEPGAARQGEGRRAGARLSRGSG